MQRFRNIVCTPFFPKEVWILEKGGWEYAKSLGETFKKGGGEFFLGVWPYIYQVTTRKQCGFRLIVSNVGILKSNYFVEELIPNVWQKSTLGPFFNEVKNVVYLSNKWTEEICILQNTSFTEKVRFTKVIHYFCFLRST